MSIKWILVADPHHPTLESLRAMLVAHGYEALLASNAGELVKVAVENHCDLGLIDLDLPATGGIEAAKTLALRSPGIFVILMAQPAAMAGGSEELLASHFTALQKPLGPGQLLPAIEQADEVKRLREENMMLRTQWEEDEGPDDFVWRSPQMIDVLRQAATAADTDEPVVIYGAPGTEKEIIALYVHRCSRRADKPFVRFECGRGSGPSEQAELFGREHHGPRDHSCSWGGRLALAAGGTLFIDNIGELSTACQARLLRFIEEGQFLPGDTHQLAAPAAQAPRCPPSPADVRIVCASAHSLLDADGANRFRKDLLYRLSALSLSVPPLSARREDILPLARRFLRRFAVELSKEVHDISPEATRLLREYSWPGNVSELRDSLRTAVTGAQSNVLLPEDLLRGPSRRVVSGVIGGVTGPTLQDAERQLIIKTLHETHGNRSEAARRLSITTSILSNRLARYRDRGLIAVHTRVSAGEAKGC